MTSFRPVYFLASLWFLVFLFIACDSKRFYEENKVIPEGVWNRSNKIHFEVNNIDTTGHYTFFLNVRNSLDYPYCNLYLFLTTLFPDGNTGKDTVECQLAEYSGKWYGTGAGSVKFNRFLFQKNVRFNYKGTYTFEVEQAMRVTDLKGITDIGIRIEKNQ